VLAGQPWVQHILWLVWVENANELGWVGVKQNWCGLGCARKYGNFILVGFRFQPISRPGPDISFYVFLKMYAFYFTEVTEPIWTSMLYMFL
jgi:hypothetical protein